MNEVVSFFNTDHGKAVRALLYVFVSGGLAALGAAVTSHPDWVGGAVVSTIAIGAINYLLVLAKNKLG